MLPLPCPSSSLPLPDHLSLPTLSPSLRLFLSLSLTHTPCPPVKSVSPPVDRQLRHSQHVVGQLQAQAGPARTVRLLVSRVSDVLTRESLLVAETMRHACLCTARGHAHVRSPYPLPLPTFPITHSSSLSGAASLVRCWRQMWAAPSCGAPRGGSERCPSTNTSCRYVCVCV